MTDWLLKDENYIPPKDKDAFIDKSILSLLNVLSRIKTQNVSNKDLFRINALFKVAFTFVLVLLLSVSKNYTFVVVITVYLLAVLSMMRGEDIIRILKISLVMTVFTFIILLPAAWAGNWYSSVMIPSKVFATVTAVNILSHSTKWNAITNALKRFFIPDIFILVLDITIKYIVMLGDFSLNMLYSLKLRSVGKNKSKYSSLSGIAGILFIKSREMAEEMYSAMECRGFTGEYRVHSRFEFSFADLIYILLNGGIIFVFAYLERG